MASQSTNARPQRSLKEQLRLFAFDDQPLAARDAIQFQEELSKRERLTALLRSPVDSDDKRKKMNMQKNSDLLEVENAAIRLGIRVLAVSRDRNSVTAAYTAIPLIEDVLRHYVCLVLKLTARGEDFDDIVDEKIEEWWKMPKAFKFPDKTERLSGTNLAVLTAVRSAEKGAPLFETPGDIANLLRLLDERNFPAHYISTPPVQLSKALITQATMLLNRMCMDGGSSITVKEVETWVRPPMRFLGKG